MYTNWRKNYFRYRAHFLNVVDNYSKRPDIKTYLEILLSLATISVFSIFALRPTLTTIAELLKEIEIKEEVIMKMDDKIQDLSRAQALFDAQRENIRLLEGAIPINPEPDTIARQIEGLSAKHGVQITNMTTGKALVLGQENTKLETAKDKDIQPAVGIMSFSVNATERVDNYRPLLNFLSDVETLRTPAKINILNFNSSGLEGESLLLVLNGDLPYLRKVKEFK
jgi:hypothetical protein